MFDSARCDATGQPLELPTVHFRCGHSFNASALGEEEECPLCSSRHRTLAQIRAAMRPTPVLEERLAREREGAEDAAEGEGWGGGGWGVAAGIWVAVGVAVGVVVRVAVRVAVGVVGRVAVGMKAGCGCGRAFSH